MAPTHRPPTMTHAERRVLIEQPFICRIIPPHPWGGVYIVAALPREGRRNKAHQPADSDYGDILSSPEWEEHQL